MKSKAKIVIAAIVLAVFLVPVPTTYKDGGSIRYRAILYDVTKYHQLALDAATGYHDGWSVKIMGIPIYNDFIK